MMTPTSWSCPPRRDCCRNGADWQPGQPWIHSPHPVSVANPGSVGTGELLAFRGTGQCYGRSVRGDGRGHEVEVAGAHLALVACGEVPVRLGAELGVLQPHVGGAALFAVPAGQ